MTHTWARLRAVAGGASGLIAAVLASLLSGCQLEAAADPPPVSVRPEDPALSRLTIAPEERGTRYRRSAFGQRWADTDRNGCDTRDDVLARDLTQVRTRGRCVVLSGVLIDPYSGVSVLFTKARADQVQIDHVVSLAEAWRSGADRWSAQRRLEFANDADELLATAAAVNDEKGDKDPSRWQPATSQGRCRYARAVVRVKARYGLTVDQPEHDALTHDLAECR